MVLVTALAWAERSALDLVATKERELAAVKAPVRAKRRGAASAWTRASALAAEWE